VVEIGTGSWETVTEVATAFTESAASATEVWRIRTELAAIAT
jgi:hypothetical protein